MSKIGAVAVGKTHREIYEIAQEARDRLTIGREGRLAIDMEWLLEKRARTILEIEIDVREDDDPEVAGAHAAFDPSERIIKIRESVMRRSRVEDPDAIFTICHELGHVFLHSKPHYFRRVLPTHLPAQMCDPEWQADLFAIEFCMDRAMLPRYDSPRSAANYFKVPLREMQIYFAQLRAQGVLVRDTPDRVEHYLARATQGELDV